ncbi:hypothetical protein ACVOZ6_004722 [Escherichia coli]
MEQTLNTEDAAQANDKAADKAAQTPAADYYDVYLQQGINATVEHIRLWSIVKKLIERDIIEGRPAKEIAEAVHLLQSGEAAAFGLYR